MAECLECVSPDGTTHTMIVATGSTVTIPATWTNQNTIHAIGGGQSGQQAASGLGGNGAAYAFSQNVAGLTPGDVCAINIGAGGSGDHVAGGDTWLKNGSGTKVVQAIGGASGSSNIGDGSSAGGTALTPIGGGDSPHAGGGGGAGCGGPDGPGADSGDIRPGNDQPGGDTYLLYAANTGAGDATTCYAMQIINAFQPGAGGGAGNGGQPGGGTAALTAVLQHSLNSYSACGHAPPPTTYNGLGPVGSQAPVDGTAVLPGDGGDGPDYGVGGTSKGGRHWALEGPANNGEGSGGGCGGPNQAGTDPNGGGGGASSNTNYIWLDDNGPTAQNNFVAGALPGGGGGGGAIYGYGPPNGSGGTGGFYGGGGGGGTGGTSEGGTGGQGVLVLQWVEVSSPSCCEEQIIVDEAVVGLLANRDLRVAHLVQFDFASGAKRLWNGNRDLVTSDTKRWSGLKKLGGIAGMEDEGGITSAQLQFTISGIDASVLALAISEDRAEYVNRLVTVWLQFFDADWQKVGAPIARAAGIMEGIKVAQARDKDGVSTRTITCTAENIFYGRGSPPASYYTDRDQQLRSPGDRGLGFVPETQNTVIPVPW